MAIVYRAYQPSLNRYVAIKALPPQLSYDQQFVERFQREAKAAARLRHPNTVVIHDVGHQDGVYYIVMEYLEGQTLKQVIEQQGPLPPDRAARIVEQIGAALDYAHREGFVHRDVKPSNIFVGQGDHVTLTDFGIAKAASETQLTRTGMLMGTPEYMSPEQAEGVEVDHRSDLYALGIVLYQILVGRVPFRGTTPHATLHAVIYEPPPPPRFINPQIPPAVEAVILKAISKQPEQRYQRGADLASALKAASASPHAVPVPPQPSALPQDRGPATVAAPRRSPLVWVVAGVAVILVAMLLILGLLIATGGRQGKTPVPVTTESVSQATQTSEAGERTPTLEPAATGTPVSSTAALPTETAEIRTDTSAPPTDTASPPTATAEPPTDTPTPTVTPSSTPTTPPPPPPCAFPAQGIFAGLWQTYRAKLGCPIHQEPKPLQDAEQAFDNGHMFWRQDTDFAYVVYEKGEQQGTYQAFTGMWSEGDPEYSCAAAPPPGKVQPKRGFGAVWCVLGGPSAAIGWGLSEEAGFGPGNGDPAVQDFEHGFILRDSDGTTKGLAYVFFGDELTFVRVAY
jgi:serine/threonine-protein kinase